MVARVELPHIDNRCVFQDLICFFQITNLALEGLDLSEFVTGRANTLTRINLGLHYPASQCFRTDSEFRGNGFARHVQQRFLLVFRGFASILRVLA